MSYAIEHGTVLLKMCHLAWNVIRVDLCLDFGMSFFPFLLTLDLEDSRKFNLDIVHWQKCLTLGKEPRQLKIYERRSELIGVDYPKNAAPLDCVRVEKTLLNNTIPASCLRGFDVFRNYCFDEDLIFRKPSLNTVEKLTLTDIERISVFLFLLKAEGQTRKSPTSIVSLVDTYVSQIDFDINKIFKRKIEYILGNKTIKESIVNVKKLVKKGVVP